MTRDWLKALVLTAILLGCAALWVWLGVAVLRAVCR